MDSGMRYIADVKSADMVMSRGAFRALEGTVGGLDLDDEGSDIVPAPGFVG